MKMSTSCNKATTTTTTNDELKQHSIHRERERESEREWKKGSQCEWMRQRDTKIFNRVQHHEWQKPPLPSVLFVCAHCATYVCVWYVCVCVCIFYTNELNATLELSEWCFPGRIRKINRRSTQRLTFNLQLQLAASLCLRVNACVCVCVYCGCLLHSATHTHTHTQTAHRTHKNTERSWARNVEQI